MNPFFFKKKKNEELFPKIKSSLYYTSLILELAVSESRRNVWDNENIFKSWGFIDPYLRIWSVPKHTIC